MAYWSGRATTPAGLLLAAALVSACAGTATDSVPFTGVISPGGGASTGSNGASVAGTYRLTTVNGAALPDTVASDSVFVANDSTNIVRETLDSGYIVLHSDTSLTEYHYLSVEDKRFGPLIASDSSIVTVAPWVIADTLTGNYSYNVATSTIIITLSGTSTDSGGVVPINSYSGNFTSDTLSGNITYDVSDLLGNFVLSNTSAFIWVKSATGPTQDRVPPLRVFGHRALLSPRRLLPLGYR